MKFKHITLTQAALQALALHAYFASAAFCPIALRDRVVLETCKIKSTGAPENLESSEPQEEEIESESRDGTVTKAVSQNFNGESQAEIIRISYEKEKTQTDTALVKRADNGTASTIEELEGDVKAMGIYDPELANLICKTNGPMCIMYYSAVVVYTVISFWRHRKEYFPDPTEEGDTSKTSGPLLIIKEHLYGLTKDYKPSEKATYASSVDYGNTSDDIGIEKLYSLIPSSKKHHKKLKKSYHQNMIEYDSLVNEKRKYMEEEFQRSDGVKPIITDEMVHAELTKGIESGIEFRNFDFSCLAKDKSKCSKTFLNYNVAMFVKDGERMLVIDPIYGGDYKDLYISIILGLNGKISKGQENSNEINGPWLKTNDHKSAIFLNFGNSREIEFEDDADLTSIGSALSDLVFDQSFGSFSAGIYSFCGKESANYNNSPKKVSSLSQLVSSIRFTLAFGVPGPVPLGCGENA